MLKPVRTSAPAATPISVSEAKSQMDVTYTDDDTIVSALVDAATAHFDGWAGVLGRCLVTQTWRVDLAEWPATGIVCLPFPDVQSISSVKYFDGDNSEQTVSSSLYELGENEKGSLVRFKDSFTSPSVYNDRLDPIQITFVAGYGDASDVPAAIRHAMLLLVAHWYENREAATPGTDMTETPLAVNALIAPYRRVGM